MYKLPAVGLTIESADRTLLEQELKIQSMRKEIEEFIGYALAIFQRSVDRHDLRRSMEYFESVLIELYSQKMPEDKAKDALHDRQCILQILIHLASARGKQIDIVSSN